jgi:DNA-binding CsgD family transcriptional regulator
MTTSTSLMHIATGGSLASRLRDAENFVAVAMAACVAAHELGLHCAVSLQSAAGDPLIAVDNAGDSPDNIFVISLPILALTEQIGAIRWSAASPVTPELRHELATMTMHVSVRLAQLGYIACHDHRDQLTGRQNDAARLAARGHTNSEIAALLALSENTVKKHLKEVFERLQVSSRTELAVRYARLAASDDVPAGISYRDGCTIMKAPVKSRR